MLPAYVKEYTHHLITKHACMHLNKAVVRSNVSGAISSQQGCLKILKVSVANIYCNKSSRRIDLWVLQCFLILPRNLVP